MLLEYNICRWSYLHLKRMTRNYNFLWIWTTQKCELKRTIPIMIILHIIPTRNNSLLWLCFPKEYNVAINKSSNHKDIHIILHIGLVFSLDGMGLCVGGGFGLVLGWHCWDFVLGGWFLVFSVPFLYMAMWKVFHSKWVHIEVFVHLSWHQHRLKS